MLTTLNQIKVKADMICDNMRNQLMLKGKLEQGSHLFYSLASIGGFINAPEESIQKIYKKEVDLLIEPEV